MRIFAAALGLLVVAVPAFAQAPPATWNGLPDRFQVDAGYFHLEADTVLRFEGADEIDFERDLAVPDGTNTFWLDATWRAGRRHQIKLSFTRLSRERRDHTLTRDFTWGGQTYQAGLTTNTDTGADVFGGYYRFALLKRERYEAGPTVGIGHLSLDARIRATGNVGGASATIDRSASKGHVTGAVGGYASAWAAERLLVYGDFLYIKVNPGDSQASVTDWRVGANYYVFRNAGVAAQYKYNRYRYEEDIVSSELGGHITFQGFQAFLSFLF
jgi:predicted porin